MTQTVWLCRRCATVFSGKGTCPDPEEELRARVWSQPPPMDVCLHDCGHGGFGVADLVGAVPEGRT